MPGRAMENDTDHAPRRVFTEMKAAFDAVASSHPALLREHPSTVAGRPAMIRTVGRRCVQYLVPPFAHLVEDRSQPTAAELTIDVWDAEETGVQYPGPHVPSDLVWPGFGHVVWERDQQFLGCLRPNLYSWIDRQTGHMVACTPNGSRFTLYERAKPFLYPLILWHGDRNAQVIHAALVEKAGRGVLIVGREGSGKTTVALACVEAGFNYLGDDYVALAEEDGVFRGHSIYNSAWIDEAHAEQFPALRAHMIPGREPKRPVLLTGVWPDRLGRDATIEVVLIPTISEGAESFARPASGREALFAVAPTSMTKRPGTSQADLNRLGRLVESARLHVLELGADIRNVGSIVDELLSEGV